MNVCVRERSSILPTDVQSEFPKYDLDFLVVLSPAKTIFCGQGLRSRLSIKEFQITANCARDNKL